jgi:putative ABC transport system permease protein
LLLSKKQLEQQFIKNIEGVDMVVGAKGSPLQLILSAVYQIDAPTGNIALSDFEKLQRNTLVKLAIPLSFGDSYEDFRIVGTEASYIQLYAPEVQTGDFPETGEVWLGADVAKTTQLQLNQSFYGNHGIQNAMESHSSFAYTVTHILPPQGNVLDKLIITNLNSVWAVHEHVGEGDDHVESENEGDGESEGEHHHEEHDAHGEKHHHEEREITAALVQFRGAMARIMLPNYINDQTPMMTALPAFEINRLFGLVSNAVFFIQALALVVILISGISVFIALYQSLQARKPELALMRNLGAGRAQLFTLICAEGLIIACFALVLSLGLSRLILIGLSTTSLPLTLDLNWWLWMQEETYLCLAALGISFLASLLPAVQAFYINIPKALANG